MNACQKEERMHSSRGSMFVLFAVAGLALLLALPSLADADGGPILSDPELWAMIDEGQQIAVVQLQQDGTAQVDLFISLTDRSGQSHEVTFFLPLGIEAGDFEVVDWLTDKSQGGAFPKSAESAYTLCLYENRRVDDGKHASPL
jgi:hypothetical protein